MAVDRAGQQVQARGVDRLPRRQALPPDADNPPVLGVQVRARRPRGVTSIAS